MSTATPTVETAVATVKDAGYSGWAGANRVLRMLGIDNVADNVPASNRVAYAFGFSRRTFG